MPSEWFVEQLDYIFFLEGLALLLLALGCLRLSGEDDRSMLPWLWLGLFGLIEGIQKWLSMLALGLPDPMAFKLARMVMLAASFAVLFEFGWRGWRAHGGRTSRTRILLPLLAPSVAVSVIEPHALGGSCVYAAGLMGSLLSAWVLWGAAAAFTNTTGKAGLRLASGAMVIYALPLGAFALKSVFRPTGWFDLDFFHADTWFSSPDTRGPVRICMGRRNLVPWARYMVLGRS